MTQRASTCTCRIAGGGTSRPHPVTSCPPLFFQVVGWMRQRISRTFDGCFAAADAQNRAELVPLIRNRTREKSRVLAGQLHARTLNSPTFSFCFCSLDNPESVCVCVCFLRRVESPAYAPRGVTWQQNNTHVISCFSSPCESSSSGQARPAPPCGSRLRQETKRKEKKRKDVLFDEMMSATLSAVLSNTPMLKPVCL